MNRKKTAVEVYLSTVFKWGLIILVSACMCATVMFNTEKCLDYILQYHGLQQSVWE